VAVACDQVPPGVALGNCRVLAGTSSWADRSLVAEGSFYPARSLSAAERLGFYASRFGLAEVATTYRFPPTPEVSRRWVEATPAGFKFDIRLWSLLCGAPTWPESLWADLQPYARPPSRPGSKLYRHHLPRAVVEECWERFVHALGPLAQAGRLGLVVARYPAWFRPGAEAWAELVSLAAELEGFKVAVELNNPRWFEGHSCEGTLGFLEELGLSFACTASLPGPAVVATTADVGFVRFPGGWGRHPGREAGGGGRADRLGGEAPGLPDADGPGGSQADRHSASSAAPAQASPWWARRYSDDELAAWVPRLAGMASSCSELHVVMDNCWKRDAVDNAAKLLELLGGRTA
jgi:uncharacterized protein YecE (DUF72 family)